MQCKNCLKLFNKASYAPRVLGCGHTLCHFCISTIMNNGEMACPFCDYKHKANGVTDIPFNHTTLEALEEEAAAEREDLCATHNKTANGFCSKCREFVCPRCFKDSHNVLFGCVEDTLEKGFETLSTSPKADHLLELIDILSKNLEQGEFNVSEAKNAELAFKECLWSVSKDRQHLEDYQEDLEIMLNSLMVFKENLSKCKTLKEFKDSKRRLSSISLVFLEEAKKAVPDLLPPSANLWSNLPTVVRTLRETLTRSNPVFIVSEERERCYQLIAKGNAIWSSSPKPLSDIPAGSLRVEMTPQLEDFLFENPITLVWGNQFPHRQCSCAEQDDKASLKATITLNNNVRDIFKNIFLCEQPSKSQYLCNITPNLIHVFKQGTALNLRLSSQNAQNQIVDITTKIDFEAGYKETHLSLRRGLLLSPCKKLESLSGFPIFSIKDDSKNVHFIIMKFPLSHADKTFEVIGHCKEAIGGLIGTNLKNWQALGRRLM